MKQYVILKITRKCGHTEDVSFDVANMFEERYQHQATIPCMQCIHGEKPKLFQEQQTQLKEPVVEVKEEAQEEVKPVLTEDDTKLNTDPLLVATFKSLSKEEQRKELIKMYAEHMTCANIAKAFGVSHPTVRGWIDRCKVSMNDVYDYLERTYVPGKIPRGSKEFWKVRGKHRRQLLIELMAKYGSMSVISKVLAIPFSSVPYFYKECNITDEEVKEYKAQKALKAKEEELSK